MGEHLVEGEVRLMDGYVLVKNRNVETVERARAICGAIERHLADHPGIGVLFDTRDTEPPGEDVRQVMWAWCEEASRLARIAIVARSGLNRLSARMTALSKGVGLKGFADVDEAAAWVRGQS